MAFPATFQDMQNNVIDKARLDSTQDLNRVKDWLNSAYYTAVIETGFYQNSSASTSPLAANATNMLVPATIVKVEFIVPTGSDGVVWGPMIMVPIQELLRQRAWQGGQVSLGAPSRYSYRSSGAPTIEFWPNANGGETLTFYGWAMPPVLSANGDTPIFPEPYSRVLEYGALIHAAEYQKDVLLIQQFQSDYQDWLQRLRGYRNTRETSQPGQLEVMFTRPYPKGNSIDQGY